MSSPHMSSRWNPPQDSNREAGRRQWNGNGTPSRRGWNDTGVSAYSPQNASPRTQLSPNRHRSPRNPAIDSDQLAQQKSQWNVERDIPSGTVRNNPFVPKKEAVQAPPQLLHQKRQWDTSEIPRGSVAARAMTMEGTGDYVAESPRAMRHGLSPSRDRSSPGRVNRYDTSPRTNTFQQDQGVRDFKPMPTMSYRGRLIENPAVSSAPPAARASSPKRWEPSREIPVGAVKGRLNNLVNANPALGPSAIMDERDLRQPRLDDRSTDEDPWIIPDKKMDPSQFFPSEWGEEALAAKSTESDDWGAPASEWLRASESQTVSTRSSVDDPSVKTTSTRKGRSVDQMEIVDEKKVSEEDSSLAGNRDADILELARQKQKMHQKDPFVTTRARDADILRAAEEKSRFGSTTAAFNAFETNTETFDGDLFTDAKSSFKDNEDNLQHAFPTSPFSENPDFAAFDFKQPTTSERKTVNALPAEKLQKWEQPEPRAVRQPDLVVSTTEEELDDDEPKKQQRKGFFNKIFGGGRKSKGTSKTPKSKATPKSSNVAKSSPKTQMTPPPQVVADVPSKDMSFEEPNFEAPTKKQLPMEDETVSEMTMPTVLKDERSPRHVVGAKLLQEVAEDYDVEDSETAQANVPSPKKQDLLRMPPPPPPPPRQAQTMTAGVLDSPESADDPALDHVNLDDDDDSEDEMQPMTKPKVEPQVSQGSKFHQRLMKKHSRGEPNVVKKSKPTTSPLPPSRPDRAVPKFVSRHAKNQAARTTVLTPSEPRTRAPPPSRTVPSAHRAREASSAISTITHDQTITTTGLGTPERPLEVHDDNSTVGGGSVSSHRTYDSASVSSDIRVLRSILRRPHRIPNTSSSVSTNPVYTNYDESQIADPMQRAGLRLLSAAVIPIQTEVRRFLAMRRALTRMWALIVIQTYTRQWMARKAYVKERNAIIKVQSLYRGREARNELIYNHICAIEIQRHVRGYLATMRVYEDIYKVTMVQSFVRMRLAMQEATRRMALVIRLQAVARGFVARNLLERQEASAIAIQANWRCFYKRLSYQFDLLDIITVQSVWRRKLAGREAEKIRNAVRERSATIIQTKWRSYDCTMNYLHYLADVLIVQSTVRRYLVLKKIRDEKNAAATKIQSAWRGFVCYADYMFSIADIVVTQKIARRWLAMRKCKAKKDDKYARAATTIQKRWRGYIDETEFVVMKYEFYAARTIQSCWRRFWCFSNFVIALDCSIQIQSTFRGYAQRQIYKNKRTAATQIASVARSYLARKELDQRIYIQHLASIAEEQALTEYHASTKLQSLVRGHQARTAVKLYVKARSIQAVWRGALLRRAYLYYTSARRIQAFWRCRRMHTAYKFYRAALTIQTKYRMEKAKRDVLVLRGEYLAATLIQSAWRGFVCYTDYIFTVSDIISAQKMARKYLARKKFGKMIDERLAAHRELAQASTQIQRVCRGFIARQRYWYTLGCTMQVQSWIRGRLAILRKQKKQDAILKLQCFTRRILARQDYLQRKFILMLVRTADQERSKRVAAMVIQERCRDFLEDKRRDDAARVIQRFFLMVKSEVDRLVRASKSRKNWRKKMKKRNDKVEDALLEDAWISALSLSNSKGSGTFEKLAQSYSHDSGTNENNTLNLKKSGSDFPALEAVKYLSRSRSQNRNPMIERPNNLKRAQQYGLPTTKDKPSTYVRLRLGEDQSEFSGLTTSTANFVRVPAPRKKLMGARELDEDLELEEAFIDAEIFNAKERQLAEKGQGAIRGFV